MLCGESRCHLRRELAIRKSRDCAERRVDYIGRDLSHIVREGRAENDGTSAVWTVQIGAVVRIAVKQLEQR